MSRGTKTSEFGAPKRENHDSEYFYSSQMYTEITPASNQDPDGIENPLPKNLENAIIQADSKDLSFIPDSSIHLVVTSPPYNARKNYDEDLTLTEYLALIEKVSMEIYPKLVDGGRFIINLANLGRKPYIPISDYISLIMTNLGYIQRGEIIWDKGASAGSSTAWGCYDSETRVLTQNGLKYFNEIDMNSDLFATINPNTKKLEYQKSFDYIEYEYNGPMVHIKSNTLDLMITPNHNMVLHNKYLDSIEIRTMSDLENRANFSIPQKHGGFSKGTDHEYFVLPSVEMRERTKKIYHERNSEKNITMDLWLRFLGYYLTDGSTYHNPDNRQYSVSIYQSKQPYADEVRSIFNELPFNYTYKESKIEFKVTSIQLSKYLDQFGNKEKRKIPKFVFDLSTRQKQIFVDSMFKGDGSFHKNGDFRYFATQSPKMFNQMLNLLLQLGITYSYYLQKARGKGMVAGTLSNQTKDIYRIQIKKSKSYFVRNRNISRTDYSGKVYCVSVPNETLFVERNGAFTWCGNSWMQASNPTLRDVHEYIQVYSKGTLKRSKDGKIATISREEFMEYTKSVWHFSTVSAKKIGHPAPYPVELVYRCIQLYSFENDVVFDPFMGSGTTAIAALDTERRYLGVDIKQDYVDHANERIEAYHIEKRYAKILKGKLKDPKKSKKTKKTGSTKKAKKK